MCVDVEPLPIDPFLPEAVACLAKQPFLVLRAPPGAGKTTRLPPALLTSGLADEGMIWMLEPRRVAARAAAARMAAERGQRPGQEVGHQIRFETRKSAATRILVVTEGILTRRLQTDPFLEGLSVVILDEFHERSIHTDLALAFLRELCLGARPDLRLVVMSATLDTGPLARFLDDCPVLDIPVQHHPVEKIYLDRRDERPLWVRAAAGVERALAHTGDLLVFLPGVFEIQQTAQQLKDSVPEGQILPLHGSLSAEDQDRAIQPRAERKIILATNVAETSLTINGVTAVVDTGFARVLRHDPRYGLDRLERLRISRASAAQRAGRAGRTGPGRVFRLWTRGEHAALAEQDRPEVLRIDLAATLLEVLAWGSDPETFGWFETPPAAGLKSALQVLVAIQAVTLDPPRLTSLGRSLVGLPLHPRLGRILVEAGRQGCGKEGALMAALLSERDPLLPAIHPTGPSDLLLRLERFQEARQQRFRPQTLRRLGLRQGPVLAVDRARRQLEKLLPDNPSRGPAEESTLMRILLAGFPDRVARKRGADSNEVLLMGGRGARLAEECSVRDSDLLLGLKVEGGQKGIHTQSLIRLASQVREKWLLKDFPHLLTREKTLAFDEETERVQGREKLLYGDLVLREKEQTRFPALEAAELLVRSAETRLDRALHLDGACRTLIERVQSLKEWRPELDLPELTLESLKPLLPKICQGKKSFQEIRGVRLYPLLKGLFGPGQLDRLEKEAPVKIPLPSGRQATLTYEPGRPPVLAIRLQELFGCTKTPRVAGGRVPVLLHLLGPNMRPVQVTDDLESFWKNTYGQVRKDLRGRYPKHAWPEDPLKPVS